MERHPGAGEAGQQAGRAPARPAEVAAWTAAYAHLPWGICLTDGAGRVRYANPAFVALLGALPPGGVAWYELFEPGGAVSLAGRVAEGAAGYDTPPLFGQLRSARGPVEVTLHAVELPGEDAGWLLACWPPSWSRGPHVAEAAVASLSHDLRTPLTTIRGLADLMLGEIEPAADRTRRYARMIRENVEALNELIDRVVAVHRFRTGRLPGAPQPVDLDDLLAHAWPAFAARAAHRNVDLELVKPTPLPRVTACPETLRLVVTSLLAYAIGAAAGDTLSITAGFGEGGEVVFRATELPAVTADRLAEAGAEARRRLYGWAMDERSTEHGELPALGMLVVATEALQGAVTAQPGSGGAGVLVVTLLGR